MAEQYYEVPEEDISLLYPHAGLAGDGGDAELTELTCEQLELGCLLDLKSCDIQSFYTCDTDTILYRQATFSDMKEVPELSPVLSKMIPFLNDITELRRLGTGDSSENYLYSIAEVELYTSLMEILKDELLPLAPRLRSPAFIKFAERINTLTKSEYYRDINDRLKELTSRVREIKSVTIGVNLDSAMRAEKAGVISVNNEPFRSGDLLNKMLRLDFKKDDMTCIAPLVPFKKGQTENSQTALANAFNGALTDIYRQSVKSWKNVVRHYVLDNTDFLLRMMPEIEFVTKASELINRLESVECGLTVPGIRPMHEKAFKAVGLRNPVVAVKLETATVPNDFEFDEKGMIYVLTGPNRGGKSVLTCAVGLAFVMAQLGLPVAADRCEISPVDRIFTHFPQGGEDTIDKGRLGEECSRLSQIFDEVTEYSLVLLDESLSSTGSYEGAYIAAEVLEGFSMARCRGIFSTHLHDLAAATDSINSACLPKGGVPVDNLVADISGGERTFRILREKPDGRSYAKDIADRYGLSIEKILEKIKKNGEI